MVSVPLRVRFERGVGPVRAGAQDGHACGFGVWVAARQGRKPLFFLGKILTTFAYSLILLNGKEEAAWMHLSL